MIVIVCPAAEPGEEGDYLGVALVEVAGWLADDQRRGV